MAKKIVRVDASRLEIRYSPKYAILCDRDLDQVVAYAAANPEVFIFPFATKGIAETADLSSLMDPPLVDQYGDWIVEPIYIGNLRPISAAIELIVRHAFEHFYDDAICILNEWEGD